MSQKYPAQARTFSIGKDRNISRATTANEKSFHVARETSSFFNESSLKNTTLDHSFQKVNPKRPQKFGLKTLGSRKPRGVNSDLPALYISKATKFNLPTMPDAVQGYKSVPKPENYKLVSGYSFEKSGASRSSARKNKTQGTSKGLTNNSFDVGGGFDENFSERSPSKGNTRGKFKSTLEDLPEMSENFRGSYSKRRTSSNYSGSNTYMRLSNVVNSPESMKSGKFGDNASDDVVIDDRQIHTNPDNVENGEIDRSLNSSSFMDRIINGEERRKKNWNFDTGAGFENIHSLLGDSEVGKESQQRPYEKSILQDSQIGRSMIQESQGRSLLQDSLLEQSLQNRPGVDSEIRENYRNDFLKLVYKGMARSVRPPKMDRTFLKTCEDHRILFKRKMDALKMH